MWTITSSPLAAVGDWSGRRARELTAACLAMRGRLCHLCELDGATSADHDPPRQDLIDLGVPDPDALEYLFPAHLTCNQRRGRRPVTPALRLELRTRRLADLETTARLSPSLEARRPAHRLEPSILERRRVVLVCGPPGSGKTTLARTLDLELFDMDDPQWRDGSTYRAREFHAAIAQLAGNTHARAVVIRAGATLEQRTAAASLIGATETILLAVPAEVCVRRVLERNRDHPPIRAQLASVREWWRRHAADTPAGAGVR